MVHLLSKEKALLNDCFKNWATALESEPEGRAIVANLLFDLRARSVTERAFVEFAVHLENTGRYKSPFPSGSLSRARVIGFTREVQDFCNLSGAGLLPARMAPPISARQIKNCAPDLKFHRVVSEQRVVAGFMLYSDLLHRVPTPTVSDALNWTIFKTKMIDSAATRKTLEAEAKKVSRSGKFVVFLTPASTLRKLPKTNEAFWASRRLGLRYEGVSNRLAVLEFRLTKSDGHWRPTTFSSGGYFAFCAVDHRDGYGRTMPLKEIGAKKLAYGAREVVVADDSPLVMEDAFALGV